MIRVTALRAAASLLLANAALAAPIEIAQISPSPTVVGQSILVTTRIGGIGFPQATGTITISDGTDACVATLPQGYCLLTPTTPGNKTITATYGGDINFVGTDDTTPHVVEPVGHPERITFGPGNLLSYERAFWFQGENTVAQSADGRFVAFVSTNPLLPADTNTDFDAYVFDRQSGEFSLVSVNDAGTVGNASVSDVAISPNGQFVAFTSSASNLVVGDGNSLDDVFVHDRADGTTVRISIGDNESEAGAPSGFPDVSVNGRIAFQSQAALVANDTNTGVMDVYVRDQDAGTTTLISVNQTAGTSPLPSLRPSISDDGNRIAFLSAASDLTATSDTNGTTDAFVRDLLGATTERISVDGAEIEAPSATETVRLSPDGTRALFRTTASLDPVDGNASLRDCYVRDLTAGSTALVSMKNDGTGPSVSNDVRACEFADSESVWFLSEASDLVTDVDEPSSLDLFRHDPTAGTTERITAGAVDSLSDVLLFASDDGQQVAFATSSGREIDDLNTDLLLYSATSGEFHGMKLDTLTNQMDQGLPNAYYSSMSADGRFVAFEADARNLVANKTLPYTDIFVRDRATGTTTRVSEAPDGSEANGRSESPALSADGRYVAFSSEASNLVAGDDEGRYDVFVHDLQTSTTLRVSVDPAGNDADYDVGRPSISADGRYVAFETAASNLLGVGNDTNGVSDIFRWDRTQPLATAIVRVSVASDGSEADDDSNLASISLDGNKVAFSSHATNLSPVGGPAPQVFLRDIGAATTTQVSVTTSNGAPDSFSAMPQLSGDGSHVAFWTDAGNLAPPLNSSQRLLRRELSSGDYDAVLDISGQAITLPTLTYGNLSSDGRYLAIITPSKLDPDDTDAALDLNAYDFDTGRGRVVRGPNGNSVQSGGFAFALALSGDGQYLATGSYSDDLVQGDTNGVADLFVFANPAFALDLEQQVDVVDVDANDDSIAPVSDASGELVVFQSRASNLGGADGNGVLEDIFSADTTTGTTERLSANNDGTPLTGAAMEPSVSGDGQIAVFVADNAGIANVFAESTKRTRLFAKAGGFSVLMRNRITNTTQRMSIPAQPGGAGTTPQIAPSGNAIVYSAPNTNAALGQPGQIEIFKIPLERVGNMLMPGAPQCVSCKARDAAGNVTGNSDGDSRAPAVSADGQWVAWETTAKNLSPTPSPCTQASAQIMLRNMVTNTIQRVGVPASAGDCGAAGTGARKPKIDWPGRKIVFESDQPLKPGDANSAPDIYLVNLNSNQLTRVSETAGGGDANGASTEPTISGDGQLVGYVSAAGNLDPEADTNGQPDVHVRSLRDEVVASRRLSRTRTGGEADSASRRPAMNYNGTRVAFDSDAGNLAPGAQAGVQHVFQRANPLTGEVVFSTGFE